MSTKSSVKKSNKKSKASHDMQHPKAFIDFMLGGWAPKTKKGKGAKVAKVKNWQQFAKRRAALGEAFPGEAIVIPTGHELFRNGDCTYRFRPHSSFFYYTGNLEPDCVLVLEPKGKKQHRAVLYVEPNPGRSEPTFFTDRHKGELWVGPRLGVLESQDKFAVDECRPLTELSANLKVLKRGGAYRVVRGVDPMLDKALPARKKADALLAEHISQQRLLKDNTEIAALKSAADSTRRGFEDIVRVLKSATNERQVEGAFLARARLEGNDVGYNIIAAAGSHACILHWNNNDGAIKKDELLLVDAGVEGPELYTADLTRTLPVSGKFSPAQREIYDLVIAAQAAAFAAVKPGNPFLAPHKAAMEVLAKGLVELGVLAIPLSEVLEPTKQYYRRYTLHGTSHMLGLDVHDCDKAHPSSYRLGKLKPGMVLTIEPGLYFQEDDLLVPKRYRGIGVRVEDDVLVSANGCTILTDVPRTSDDVEGWMADIWQQG